MRSGDWFVFTGAEERHGVKIARGIIAGGMYRAFPRFILFCRACYLYIYGGNVLLRGLYSVFSDVFGFLSEMNFAIAASLHGGKRIGKSYSVDTDNVFGRVWILWLE